MSMRTWIFLLLGFSITPLQAAQTFLSQSYIDSLINKALFEFTAVSDPASGKTIETAIKNAKDIALKLRVISEDDVNKRFILSKVSELENQIYLEEHELTTEKEQWKKKKSNQIISDYNQEIGKSRPNFKLLLEFQNQIESLDPEKTTEIAHSIKSRAESILKEIFGLIDQNLNEHLDAAYSDLSFCQNYAHEIGISKADLARFEAKLLARTSMNQSVTSIKSNFDSIKTCISKMKIGEAHRLKSIVNYQIDILKQEMVTIEWNRYSMENQLLEEKIRSKEDSCIASAMKLLRDGRIVDAGDLIDTISKAGVSTEKISNVNKLLLEKIILHNDDKVGNNIYSFEDDSNNVNPAFQDFVLIAKNRAMAHRDSVSKIKEQNVHMTQISEIRRDRLSVSQEELLKRIETKRSASAQNAFKEMVTIYTYIENHDLENGKKYFSKIKKLLETNLPEDDFKKLNSDLQLTSVQNDTTKVK